MSEWRQDPLSGRWVVVAPERGLRPDALLRPRPTMAPGPCALCPGREPLLPRALVTQEHDGLWQGRAFPNPVPALRIEPSGARRVDGPLVALEGLGAHELLVPTRRHGVPLTRLSRAEWGGLFAMYRSRAVDLARDSRLAQLELFGVEGDGEPGHAHLQLRALPHGVLTAPHSTARGSEVCPTCDLVAHELQQRVRVVQSGPHAVVLVPFAPLAPVELWVVPRSHAAAAHDASDVVVDAVSRALAETLPLLDRLAGMPVVVWRLESVFRPGDPGAHWRVVVRTATAHAAVESLSGLEPVLPLSPESVADALRAALGSMD